MSLSTPPLPYAADTAARALALAPKPAPDPAPAADGARIGKVARQFEAIFIREMLAEARKTNLDYGNNGDGLFGNKDQTFLQMQDARFAEIASEKGIFGIATMIGKRLLARSAAAPPLSSAPAPAPSPTAAPSSNRKAGA